MTQAPVPTNISRQFDDGVMQPRTTATIGWAEAVDRLNGGGTFWLTTVTPDGHPHTRPVFAVLVDDALHVSSSVGAVKHRHLATAAPTSIARSTDALDIVWAGTPRRVTDPNALSAVVDAYDDAYGWDVAVGGDALTAPYGAPTAGPPPYAVFRIEPHTVHAVATDAPFLGRSTRWDFVVPQATTLD